MEKPLKSNNLTFMRLFEVLISGDSSGFDGTDRIINQKKRGKHQLSSYRAGCRQGVDHLSPHQEAAKADPVIQECDEAGITLQGGFASQV